MTGTNFGQIAIQGERQVLGRTAVPGRDLLAVGVF